MEFNGTSQRRSDPHHHVRFGGGRGLTCLPPGGSIMQCSACCPISSVQHMSTRKKVLDLDFHSPQLGFRIEGLGQPSSPKLQKLGFERTACKDFFWRFHAFLESLGLAKHKPDILKP